MIINHNMNAMNAHRLMSGNTANAGKSMEKLSSGLRINRAGDDAAGLAISEKMRGQIRGLDQASRNSQDGISMLQTAEGALNETHSILQRMRELATQASNDTNVGVDRTEIQKEMNQLSSEINRIGNTTEFNTQSILKGDGASNLKNSAIISEPVKLANGADAKTTEAKRTDAVTTASTAGEAITYTINGQALTLNFATDSTLTNASKLDNSTTTATSATIGINGTVATTSQATSMAEGLQAMIDKNEVLKGSYKVSVSGSSVVIEAIKGGEFEGSKGSISAATGTGSTDMTNTAGSTTAGSHTAAVASTKNIDLSTIDTDTEIEALVGKGMTINGQQIEFYNANKGAYTGDAIGVNISDALAATAGSKDEALAKTIADQLGSKLDGVNVKIGTATNTIDITAKVAGKLGDNIEIKDGGIQKAFEATFQVGANKGQGFKIDINDMRAAALAVTGTAGTTATEGAKFTTANTVTNGTDSTTREAALDVSSYENATAAVKVINNAIETVSAERSKLGAFQNRLEHTIANLGTSSENLTAAESRIRDVDMAKEMMSFSKNNILSQAAQAMLAQAQQQPQGVLQLLR